MFLLQFQEVIEDRSRIVVWVLLACIAPLVLILFWRGVKDIPGWTSADITSYYLFTIVMYAIVMCHQEEHIATTDIQEGGLTAYLLKPFSYFWLTFFNEVSYRIIEGIVALVILAGFILFFPRLFSFTNDPATFALSILIVIVAFLLTFVFKMGVGMLAFWMTESKGAFEAVNMTITLFSGILMPLAFLPNWLEPITSFLPFSYMIYFPVIAFEGKLSIPELWHVLGMQLVWLVVFYFLYQKLWKEGLKQYTAVGQ